MRAVHPGARAVGSVGWGGVDFAVRNRHHQPVRNTLKLIICFFAYICILGGPPNNYLHSRPLSVIFWFVASLSWRAELDERMLILNFSYALTCPPLFLHSPNTFAVFARAPRTQTQTQAWLTVRHPILYRRLCELSEHVGYHAIRSQFIRSNHLPK